MPERGTKVALPGLARIVVRGLGYFTWPLRIDDYLELITPLWSVEELRGRIERVHRETDDAVTV
ncbi:MAG: stearoyl-CoA 9-desaturase oxidoreductase, partial [Mycobacterium sp.]|nr:stearoyl-CoA 9-desaturase oxidoreductase [Mycobacterium sp.]